MNQAAKRANLILWIIWLSVLSVLIPAVGTGGSFADFSIECREMKAALDSVRQERDELRIVLSEAQNTVALMRAHLSTVDGESEVFRRQALQMKLRIGALGLDSPRDKSNLEPRLLSAVSDLRIAIADKKNFSAVLVRMIDSASAFANATSAVDVSSRLALEGEIRNANTMLENSSKSIIDRQREPSVSDVGRVVSIKEDLFLIVMNLGSRQGIKVGMPFKVLRSDKLIGMVRVVDVREKISGAVIQNLRSESNRIAFGDNLSVDALQ